MVVEPGLCQTWSETLKTGFLITRLMFSLAFIARTLRATDEALLARNSSYVNQLFIDSEPVTDPGDQSGLC